MFDVVVAFFVELIGLLPVIFALYVIFDFIGSLLFGKN